MCGISKKRNERNDAIVKDISHRDFLKGTVASAIGLAATGLTGMVAFTDDALAAETGLRYDENGVCINTRAEYFAATTPEVGEISAVEDFDIVVIGADNGVWSRALPRRTSTQR